MLYEEMNVNGMKGGGSELGECVGVRGWTKYSKQGNAM